MLPVPLAALPEMPLLAVLVHANVEPPTEEVSVMFVGVPLHSSTGVLVTAGLGLTVTPELVGVPEHPLPAVGVMV